MPDGLGINAGRQTREHLQLSRALWLRQRGKTSQFHFDPAAGLGLTIGQDAGAGQAGVMLVGEDDDPIFCVGADPAAFLQQLAAWAKHAIAEVPALAILADCGAAKLADLAAPIDPAKLDIYYDSALWDDLLVPDEATVADALAATVPGERMWFWLTADPGDYAVPLIVQPLAWDPNHDRMAWLVDRNAELGAEAGVTGICSMSDDGTIQFLGDELRPAMLDAIADWVANYAEEYPALTRLAHSRLLLTSDDVVEQVYEHPELWTGILPDPVPGTLAATAAVLAVLQDGGDCWFWLTGGAGAPFLHLVPSAADPDGDSFRAELPHLYARFPQSHVDAISGVMTKLAGGQLLFVTSDGREEAFASQIEKLLSSFGKRFPVLQTLTGGRIVRPVAAAAE